MLLNSSYRYLFYPEQKMKAAFTLLELIVTVAIVAIVAGIIYSSLGTPGPFFMSPTDRAFYEEQKRANDLRERELELQYRLQTQQP